MTWCLASQGSKNQQIRSRSIFSDSPSEIILCRFHCTVLARSNSLSIDHTEGERGQAAPREEKESKGCAHGCNLSRRPSLGGSVFLVTRSLFHLFL